MTVLAVIGVLALLIFVHELGHFMAARLQGIHVNRFSIGFGPILWKYQGPQTEYALRAIPLGGFVGFPDEDPDSTIPPDDPNLLGNRPVLDRAIVISAGVIANMVFAYMVFVVQFGSIGVPDSFNLKPGVFIPEVMSGTPAEVAGIKAGDVILAVNGDRLGSEVEGEDSAQRTLIRTIQANENRPVDLTLQRFDKELAVSVTPQINKPGGDAVIGVALQPNGSVEYRRANSPTEVLSVAAREFQEKTVLVANGMLSLITDFSSMAGQVGSPVKIVEQGAGLAKTDGRSLFPFAAIISINLAIINILPLPALDGGQLAFLMIEALRGKPLPVRLQESVMQTGIFLLLGLGVFLIIRDTTQLEVLQNLRQ
ncbi:RIP metalloprotease RseP [Synechococcus sp. PCC 7335]|uniref:RIP metalloprotease RseP n=1 Tax=Synechococcus sp. (strain ATCC 29403 / PCC 7335) TaxID=91464 RepID=UPI00017EBBDE|nr:RIP metalloprotease RseP [Synechococcus sp. PCC 7335]EDX84093.1 RIP metalloprotease RseP [Synechococcus sp. PCC 7335]